MAGGSFFIATYTKLEEATGQETRMDLSNKELNDQSEDSFWISWRVDKYFSTNLACSGKIVGPDQILLVLQSEQ